MPRPLSDSWQYFEFITPYNGRKRKARCNFCGHEQSAGITRLHQHLLYRCPKISSDIRDQLKQKQEDREQDLSPKSTSILHDQTHQLHRRSQHDPVDYHFESDMLQNTPINNDSSPNMNAHPSNYNAALSPTTSTDYSATFQSSDTSNSNGFGQQQQTPQSHHSQPRILPGNRSQAMLDWQLARALYSANIPFEAIENPFMIEFLKQLQPNYVVPKGGRLQQVLLKEQHWDLIKWDSHEQSEMMQQQPRPSPIIHSPSPIARQHSNPIVSRMMLPVNDATRGVNAVNNSIDDRLSSLHSLNADLESNL